VTRPDVHALTAAYALDGLPPEERARFERHLSGCAACAAEVAGFRETAGQLAAVVATEPPATLRGRVLDSVARTPQLGRPDSAVRVLRSRWLAVAGGAVAAAAIVAAVLFGIAAGHSQDRLDGMRHQQREIAAVLGSRDVTVHKAAVATGGTATAVMSHRMHALVFSATGLAPPPAGRRYELWLVRQRGDASVGMLPAQGSAVLMMASGLEPGDALGLSIEPTNGSPRPTGPMLLVLQL
jgi:Uncharacterized protein conserved in bacteria